MENSKKVKEIIKNLKSLGLNLDPLEYEFVYVYPPLYSLKPKKENLEIENIFSQKDIESISLYFHIPFCSNLCHYCYYYKLREVSTSEEISVYLEHLEKEIGLIKKRINIQKVKSIYIGGGTPSLLPSKELKRLLNLINSNFSLSAETEYTFECHPTSLREDFNEKMKILKEYGVNRISIGIQTLKEDILNKLGRSNGKDVIELLKEIKENFEKVNIDLIYGLPGQEIEDIVNDINEITELGIPSITYYRLWFKQRTSPVKPFIEFFPRDEFPDLGTILQMKIKINELLGKKGYIECMSPWYVKNETYANSHQKSNWSNEPYLGFGVSAYSYLNNIEFKNRCFLDDYYDELNKDYLPICSIYKLKPHEVELRKLILGLKMREGVNVNKNQLSDNVWNKIEKLKEKGFAETNNNEDEIKVKLTDDGFLIADYICKYLFKDSHVLPKGKTIHCVCGFKRRNIWKDAINVYKEPDFSINLYEKIMYIEEKVKNEIIDCLYSYVKKYYPDNTTLNILSVGVGYGRLEIPFYKKLIENNKKLKVYAYDINKSMLEKFQENIEKIQKNDNLTWSIKNRDIMLVDLSENSVRYDIVTLFNFIYHLDTPLAEKFLNKLNSLTDSNSPLIILTFTGGWLESLYTKEQPHEYDFIKGLKNFLIGKGIEFEGYYSYWLHDYFSSGYEGHIHRFDWTNKINAGEFLNILIGEKKVFSFSNLLNPEGKKELKEKIKNQGNIDIPMAEILVLVKKINNKNDE